ncbi:MAG: hypothetical protein DRN04_12760 [Thermoprotei archaeon]|nr:MAG: hypothetical protein DRN04_12760 [Thermoprotei archaeon]
MKWWERILVQEEPVIVLGKTRTGKTTAVLNFIYQAKNTADFYIIDLYGEYGSLDLPRYKPFLPFKALKPYLPYILSAALRPSSSGFEIAAAAEEALKENPETWEEFFETLEVIRTRYYHGVLGIKSRLLPIRELLVDEDLPLPPPGIIDLSQVYRLDSKFIFQAVFSAWLLQEAMVKEFPRTTFLVIEEASEQNLPSITPIIISAMRLLGKHNIRPIALYHTLPDYENYEKTLRQMILMVFNVGQISEDYFKFFNFPRDVKRLKKGHCLIYIPSENKWYTVKIKAKILPSLKKATLSPLITVNKNNNEDKNTKKDTEVRISNSKNNQEEFKKELNAIQKEIQKMKEVIGNVQSKSPSILSEQVRSLATEIERVKRRVAASESSIDRVFDDLETIEKRLAKLEMKISKMEEFLRKIAEFIEFRVQEASMRGEEYPLFKKVRK